MPETTTLKLTVYQPAVMADPGGQVGFEYELAIVTPDLKTAARGDPARAASATCEVVPVTGTLSFPNPAAPVISPARCSVISPASIWCTCRTKAADRCSPT